MNGSRQVPPGEPSASGGAADDAVAAIEHALVAMRRSEARRRASRRAEEWGDGAEAGEHSHGYPHEHQHRRGHPHGGGPGFAGPEGSGFGHRRGAGFAQAARFRLLEALERAERPPSVGQLAEAIGVDQPRASRLVQAAVEAGHARREIDPADARRSAIVLTPAGREVLAAGRERRRSAVETALAGFTPEETAEFARLFARFVAGWPNA